MTSVGALPHQAALLAVDLGGTRLRVAVFNGRGDIVHKSVVPTPSDRPAALTDAMADALAAGGVPARGAVVGVPGPVAYRSGEILRLANLPAWEGRVSAGRLADALDLPVLLANDADLGALGEHRFGAGTGTQDMLYVTASTGVGAGVILGGRLLYGNWSLAEVGHMIIDRDSGGTVESLGSGTALRRLAAEDPARLTARAQAGEERARDLLREVADAFAIGVVNMAYCFMPERIVIGGGLAQAGDLLLNPVRERLTRHGAGLAVTAAGVVRARGGDDVGLQGAFALGTDVFAVQGARTGPLPVMPARSR